MSMNTSGKAPRDSDPRRIPAPAECLALLAQWSDVKAREAAAFAAETVAREGLDAAEEESAAVERELTEVERELCTCALAAVGRTPEDVDSTKEPVIVVVGGHAFRVDGGRNGESWSCNEVEPDDYIILDPDAPPADDDGSMGPGAKVESDRREARANRFAEPIRSVEEDQQLYSYRGDKHTLDQVLAAELEDFRPGEDPDRALWQGGVLRAIIRGRDGEVVRLDAPEAS